MREKNRETRSEYGMAWVASCAQIPVPASRSPSGNSPSFSSVAAFSEIPASASLASKSPVSTFLTFFFFFFRAVGSNSPSAVAAASSPSPASVSLGFLVFFFFERPLKSSVTSSTAASAVPA